MTLEPTCRGPHDEAHPVRPGRKTINGLCPGHYQQERLGKAFTLLRVRRSTEGDCEFGGCSNPIDKQGLCAGHRSQLRRGEELHPIRKRTHRTVTAEGYVKVYAPNHPNCQSRGWIYEHVKVMSEILGRPLVSHENVHHVNGVRDDNRPENLELWSTNQPSGQRVVDKIQWAKDFIRLYEPESLR
jgi:hypothetical protein